MIEYKLLDNNTGVILTRQPETAAEELLLSFKGAPEEATAIIETGNGKVYYRKLMGTSCGIATHRFAGDIKITVALLDGSARPRKWICEELKTERLDGGRILVCPNDMNLPDTVTALRIENGEIRQELKELRGELARLIQRLENLMEGYDIT